MNRQSASATSATQATARQIIIDMSNESEDVPVIMTSERDQEVPNRDVPNRDVPNFTAPASLVKSFCTNLNEMRNERSIVLPIKKINNISVEVAIAKESKHVYILSIEPTQFSVVEDSLYEEIYNRAHHPESRDFTENEYLEYIVKKILWVLKNITIDKLNGQFVAFRKPINNKFDELWIEFCQEFKEVEHLELTIKECCVCFTMTKTITNCGHFVCLECISKLRIEPPEAPEHNQRISCPMCRQRILSIGASP
jgi:hypothetical protein